jgi:hypothetical protein
MTIEGPATVARHAAARGALVAAGCAVLTAAAVAIRPPHLLTTVLGPPPLPAVLAAVSVLTGGIAGALAGRRASRTAGGSRERIGRVALILGIAYLGAVAAAVVAMSLAEQGLVALAFPFELVARGLTVALLLAPWAALPVLGAVVAVERLTRPPGARARPRRVRIVPPRG